MVFQRQYTIFYRLVQRIDCEFKGAKVWGMMINRMKNDIGSCRKKEKERIIEADLGHEIEMNNRNEGFYEMI